MAVIVPPVMPIRISMTPPESPRETGYASEGSEDDLDRVVIMPHVMPIRISMTPPESPRETGYAPEGSEQDLEKVVIKNAVRPPARNVMRPIEPPRAIVPVLQWTPLDQEIVDKKIVEVVGFRPLVWCMFRNPSVKPLLKEHSPLRASRLNDVSLLSTVDYTREIVLFLKEEHSRPEYLEFFNKRLSKAFEGGYLRGDYKRRVLHPSAFQTLLSDQMLLVPPRKDEELIPIQVLNEKEEALGRHDAYGDLLVPKGYLCRYKGDTEVRLTNDRLVDARIDYANMLLGILDDHRWSRHVEVTPEKGMKILMHFLAYNKRDAIAVNGSHVDRIRESLSFLRNAYLILMTLAPMFCVEKTVEGMEGCFSALTKAGRVVPMCEPLRDYMFELFKRRQVWLKRHLSDIANFNKVPENVILRDIKEKNDLFKLPREYPELLILQREPPAGSYLPVCTKVAEFYPMEAMIFEGSRVAANEAEL